MKNRQKVSRSLTRKTLDLANKVMSFKRLQEDRVGFIFGQRMFRDILDEGQFGDWSEG